MVYITEPKWYRVWKYDFNISLSRVSKQIPPEALDNFYSEDLFVFDISCDTSEYFTETPLEYNRQRIRHLGWHFEAFLVMSESATPCQTR